MKKKSKNILVCTRISPDENENLNAYAINKGISLYEAIRELLLYGLHMKEHETQTVSILFESIDEKLTKVEKENDERNEEILKYLKRIYYHSFRGDMSLIEFARRVQDSEFADDLDRTVDDIVKGS